MASRNNRGRNLFSANPNGSKLAYARYEALRKAEAKGIRNEVVFYLESAGSVQSVKSIEERFSLNSTEVK